MLIKRPFICTEVGITQNCLDSVCAVIEGEILYSDIKQSKKNTRKQIERSTAINWIVYISQQLEQQTLFASLPVQLC